MILMAVSFALNVDFSSCNKPVAVNKPADSVSTAPNSEKERWLKGRDLFRANCASCHNIKFDGAGPALNGVKARWIAAGAYKGKSGEQWLKTWIRNWHDVVDADYKYGVEMANSRPAQMNIFNWLDDGKIDDILFYVESPDLSKPVEK